MESNPEYKDETSVLSLIKGFSDGLKLVIESVTGNSNTIKVLTERVNVLETALMSGGSSTTSTDGSTGSVTEEIIYNRIKTDLLGGKIVPLRTVSAESVEGTTLTEISDGIDARVTKAIAASNDGGVRVYQATNSDQLEGLSLEDIMTALDIKLANKYLTTGEFTTTTYPIEAETTVINLELKDNNRFFNVYVDGKLINPINFTLDGNTLTLKEPVSVGAEFIIQSFREIVLINEKSKQELIDLVTDYKDSISSTISREIVSDENVDVILGKIDAKLDDFSIVDGKVKIEDDAIISADDGIGGNSDWALLDDGTGELPASNFKVYINCPEDVNTTQYSLSVRVPSGDLVTVDNPVKVDDKDGVITYLLSKELPTGPVLLYKPEFLADYDSVDTLDEFTTSGKVNEDEGSVTLEVSEEESAVLIFVKK